MPKDFLTSTRDLELDAFEEPDGLAPPDHVQSRSMDCARKERDASARRRAGFARTKLDATTGKKVPDRSVAGTTNSRAT